ncbi:MAG: hypothetical protein NT022_11645 [Deltaproteobacteria bacterium]|nr:hypothetical protein [Deltaproteobacteria bacterium]
MKTNRILNTRSRIISLLAFLFAFMFIFSGIAYSAGEKFHDISKLRLPTKLQELVKNKPRVSEQTLKLYRMHQGRYLFQVLPGEEVQLISPELMEYTPTKAQIDQSLQVAPNVLKYQSYYKSMKRVTLVPICAATIDHSAKQTPIKDQGSRGTCVAHAAMAGLEVGYGSTALNLSENYAYYKFLGSNPAIVCADPGLKTIDAADLMTVNKMSEESCWPYVGTLSGLGCATPSGWPVGACAAVAKYQVTSHKKIWRLDTLTSDEGEYINNPKYLESILCAGHEIVAGFHVAGWPSGAKGIIDVTSGSPIQGGHAMLIVGYVRTTDPSHGGGYFIIKNSWGTNKGQAGYVYLTYDYIRTYAKYGFYITGVLLPKKPDLTVTISGPATAKPGQNLGKSIKVKLTNKGTVTAKNVVIDLVISSNNTVPVKFAVYNPSYSDDVLLKGGRENVASIAPGATIDVTLNGTNQIPANTKPGKYYLGVVADPGKTIDELNEGNNTATTPITIQ